MVIATQGARARGGHFRQRVWLRFDLILTDEDFDWILEQVRLPEYPTFVRIKGDCASQVHLVQMKKEPGVRSLGYVVLGPRDEYGLCLLTAYKHHPWSGDGKSSNQRKAEYARVLKQVKEWKR